MSAHVSRRINKKDILVSSSFTCVNPKKFFFRIPKKQFYASQLAYNVAYLASDVQVLNGNPYNRKCDVYSFGICLWEIYCCDMPYPDLSFSEVTSAVVRQVKFCFWLPVSCLLHASYCILNQ
jgi:serine/threonine protein kinase